MDDGMQGLRVEGLGMMNDGMTGREMMGLWGEGWQMVGLAVEGSWKVAGLGVGSKWKVGWQ